MTTQVPPPVSPPPPGGIMFGKFTFTEAMLAGIFIMLLLIFIWGIDVSS